MRHQRSHDVPRISSEPAVGTKVLKANSHRRFEYAGTHRRQWARTKLAPGPSVAETYRRAKIAQWHNWDDSRMVVSATYRG